ILLASVLIVPTYLIVRAQSAPPMPRASTDSAGLSGPGDVFSLDGPVFARRGRADSSAIAKALLPPITPLLDLHLRDTSITVGKDGKFYLTGSSGDNVADHNDGIE